MRSDRLAAGYLALQGVAGVLWWMLLLASDWVRDRFFVGADGWAAGRSLLLADVVVFALGSLTAAALVHRGHPWAQRAVWVTVGATCYATLVAVGWVAESIGRPLGLAAMATSLVATVAAAVAVEKAAGDHGRVDHGRSEA